MRSILGIGLCLFLALRILATNDVLKLAGSVPAPGASGELEVAWE
jgi:hypothetical protein